MDRLASVPRSESQMAFFFARAPRFARPVAHLENIWIELLWPATKRQRQLFVG
jgi:hypothetical protein